MHNDNEYHASSFISLYYHILRWNGKQSEQLYVLIDTEIATPCHIIFISLFVSQTTWHISTGKQLSTIVNNPFD